MSRGTLSREARALLGRLEHHPRRWPAAAGRRDDNIPILHRLAECCEPAAIPWILPFAVSGPTRRQLAAVSTLEKLLGEIRPRDVIWLDEHVRRWLPRMYGSYWQQVSPLDLSSEILRRPGMLRLATCHSNGFVREAALVRLDTIGINGSDLPFLIVRLNDWVPAVSNTADHLFRKAVSQLDASELLPGLAILPWIRQTGLRKKLQWAASKLTESLDRPLAAYARQVAIRSDDREIRREGYRALARSGELDLATVATALTDSDPLIAGATLSAALTIDTDTAAKESLLRAALRSPHGSIRALAIRVSAAETELSSVTLGPSVLFDTSAAVREAARSAFEDLPTQVALETGLAAIRSGRARQRAAALLGLAELGSSAGDIDSILEEFRSDESARVRAGVMRCKILVHGRLNATEILRGLADPSPRVARTVLRFSTRNHSVQATDLWNAVANGEASHTRRCAFRMLSRRGKWASLQYVLKARLLPDIEVRQLAEIEFRRWLQRKNRSFVKPNDIERTAIRAELDLQAGNLDERTRELIEFVLR